MGAAGSPDCTPVELCGTGGGDEQAAMVPTIASTPNLFHAERTMILLLLEALGALLLLLGLVWWTMFSGRPRGELRPGSSAHQPPDSGTPPHTIHKLDR